MNNSQFIEEWFKGKRTTKRNPFSRHYCNLQMDKEALYSYGTHFPLVKECKNGYILNGDSYSSSTSGHQNAVRWHAEAMGKKFVIIPYSMLEAAGLSVLNLYIIDKREDDYRTVKYTDPATGEKRERGEHLLGACVIRNGLKMDYYLSSVDTGAVRWGRGYFLTKLLDKKVKDVTEAFWYLKPVEVRNAEADDREIKRQGEWFFVYFGDSKELKEGLFPLFVGKKFSLKKCIHIHKGFVLPPHVHQEEGHHKVRDVVMGTNELYCRGTVRHTNGEHRMLKLGEEWWMAYKNRQEQSWSAEGRVD